MNLRQLKIRPRLLLCFAAMLVMAAVLAGIGGFGLTVAQKALNGITRELIPANNITVSARTRLLESLAATATLVASIYDTDGIKRAKADWDRAQQGLDKAMLDYGAISKQPQSQEKLAAFRDHIAKYRTSVASEVVMGLLNRVSVPKKGEVFHEEDVINCFWSIKVDLFSFLESKMVEGAIVVINADYRSIKMLGHCIGNRGFT